LPFDNQKRVQRDPERGAALSNGDDLAIALA
jgi:hypothetical protein